MSSPAPSIDGSIHSSQQMLSSPSRAPPASNGSRKARKPPNITPKRFNRFFTPRSSAGSEKTPARPSRSGRQLRDITREAINRVGSITKSSSTKRALFEDVQPSSLSQCSTPRSKSSKRRRISSAAPDSSPPRSSPCHQASDSIASISYAADALSPLGAGDDEYSIPSPLETMYYPEPRRRLEGSSTTSRVLHRSFGGRDCIGRGSRYDHCAGKNGLEDFRFWLMN